MTTITVTTQAELDAAIKAHGDSRATRIIIASPRNLWLTVRAYDSATVEAYDSATVEAYDSATVRAYDSATVRAYDSATVRAYDSTTVRAGSHVAVHKHTTRAAITGGVIIDHTALDQRDPQTWAAYVGATVQDGRILLYKAVDADCQAGHEHTLTRYPIGSDVTAPDWRPDHECGGGLHASPHPHQARMYFARAERMLLVSCPIEELHPIPGGTPKVKARTFRVEREVRMNGDEL